MWFFFPFAATVLGILIENVWKSHSRPPIGRSLTIWEMEQRMILKATSRDQHQKSLHRTLLIKVLNASVGRKTGSKSVSHVPSLTFTLLGSPPPRELQNRWPWWSRLFFLKKYSNFWKKYIMKKILVDFIKWEDRGGTPILWCHCVQTL